MVVIGEACVSIGSFPYCIHATLPKSQILLWDHVKTLQWFPIALGLNSNSLGVSFIEWISLFAPYLPIQFFPSCSFLTSRMNVFKFYKYRDFISPSSRFTILIFLLGTQVLSHLSPILQLLWWLCNFSGLNLSLTSFKEFHLTFRSHSTLLLQAPITSCTSYFLYYVTKIKFIYTWLFIGHFW